MQKIAILYQANLPPLIDGIQKPMKEGGYSDSGADIACALQEIGWPLVTPVESPQLHQDFDWVFPDTTAGIQMAYDRGARIFWLNTVLFGGHPVESFFSKAIAWVGQEPKMVGIYDDKWKTNQWLKKEGLAIPESVLLSQKEWKNTPLDIPFPVVIKPLRGRGSQGVSLAENREELEEKLSAFFAASIYGNSVYLEQFLTGQEITITVMPPGRYTFGANSEADASGKYYLFDINLKPNMTGPSRPHRQGQDSLSALAARKLSWSYTEMIGNILAQRWSGATQG